MQLIRSGEVTSYLTLLTNSIKNSFCWLLHCAKSSVT